VTNRGLFGRELRGDVLAKVATLRLYIETSTATTTH
jgi:hypothetical protein